jgi:hypothetical protein
LIFPERKPNDPRNRIIAARDPIAIPTEPWVVAVAEKALCVISLGHNCYVLTNVYGDEATVPYEALQPEWERIAYGLLAKALRETP